MKPEGLSGNDLAALEEMLLHRWRHKDGDVSDAVAKLIAEVKRLKKAAGEA